MHTQPTLDDLKTALISAQIKALQTLERLMDDPEPCGDEKADKAKSTERNRQRMAATQALIHCRAMHKMTSAKTDNPDAPAPRAGEGGDRSQIDRRMRGRSESSDRCSCGMLKQSLSMSSPVPKAHAQTSLSMPPKPFPTPIGKALAAQLIAAAGNIRTYE